MIALPAVDLRDGACVQLVGGSYQAERIRLPDPVAVARGWRERGLPELHLVDLDAATRRGDNRSLVERIVRETGATVQVGGGIDGLERIDALLGAGAARVIVGTRGVEDPEWLGEVATARPGRVVLAADVRGREVVTRGWTRGTGVDLADLLGRLDPVPLAGVLVTAVHVEGALGGPDLEVVRDAVAATRHPVQAAGGIRDLADLRALRAAGAGRAVIGMAFYAGDLDPEAVAKEFGR